MFFVKVAGRNTEFAALQAEFWLYAVRNPEAMGVMAAKTDEQIDMLEPFAVLLMERFGVATEGLRPARWPGSSSVSSRASCVSNRLDPAAVPDDLLTQALRWLVGGMRPGATTDRAGLRRPVPM